MTYENQLRSMLLGLAVGDALGVPFEFQEPENLVSVDFTNMTGFQTHNQPPGTFSDDSSLTFCLVESLIEGKGALGAMNKFIRWKNEGYWSAGGHVFDIGQTIEKALLRFEQEYSLDTAAPRDEFSCGNGALMRILPLAFYAKNKALEELYDLVVAYASITHGHLRSHMACLILVKFASEIMEKQDKSQTSRIRVYNRVMIEIETFFLATSIFKSEISHFERLFNTAPHRLQDLNNTGYVIHSLEIVLHAFLKYNRYEKVVIDVIKKGGDTDTNACIAGGLAGLFYGDRTIPAAWLKQLVKRKEICDLSVRWAQTLN